MTIGQPQPFRTTPPSLWPGVPGYALPDFSAVNAGNGHLINVQTKATQFKSIKLFVYGIETDWSLQGSLVQTRNSRTFYPLHVVQNALTIKGMCANQFEYDKLVEFVQHHHMTAINPNAGNYPFPSAISFRLDNWRAVAGYGMSNLQTPHMIPGGFLFYWLVIENIEAGAERFRFAVPFTLQCKVLDDATDGKTLGVANVADQDKWSGDKNVKGKTFYVDKSYAPQSVEIDPRAIFNGTFKTATELIASDKPPPKYNSWMNIPFDSI